LIQIVENGLSRTKRNVLGDFIHAITGLATDDRLNKIDQKEEEIKKKISSVLSHQVAYEEEVNAAVVGLQSEEQRIIMRLDEFEKKVDRGSQAMGRILAYQEMLREDEEMLEDVLESMRSGRAPVRLDAYLSTKSKLLTLAGYSYVGSKAVPGGAIVEYTAGLYTPATVLEEYLEGGVRHLRTEHYHYVLHPSLSLSGELSEFEVNLFLFKILK
jgi:hypothetical protein